MKPKALITIIRPANVIFGSLTVIIGVLTSNWFIISTTGIPRWVPLELVIVLLLTTITYSCIAAAGNVINDIYDLEIDRINRPDRPLPSGQLTIRQARLWTGFLVILGVVFSALTLPYSAVGMWTLAIVALFALIGLLYAAKGKVMGLLGNFAVSISFAFGLFYGALVTYPIIPPVIFVYFITAASVLQGREAIKGIEDVEGDALRDVQTIARRYGIRTAAYVGAIANIIGIIAFCVPWIANMLNWNWTGPLYIIGLIPGVACVAASTILVLRNPTKNASRASFFDKIGAYIGLLTIIMGTIILV